MRKVISNIKKFYKDFWLGIKISNDNYLSGKTSQGKF
jgi:hypothetical protein